MLSSSIRTTTTKRAIITATTLKTPKRTTSTTIQNLNNPRSIEALSLYRDIIRTAKKMHWCDEKGEPWNVRLQTQARNEFDIAKYETDALIVMRMIITGRDCLDQIQRKMNVADEEIKNRIERERSRK